MSVMVKPSVVSGSVATPPSKSMTHRVLLLAALASGRSVILNPLIADDTEATLRVLSELGIEIRRSGEWEVDGGYLDASNKTLDCGESGTTLRFMTAACALVDGDSRLTGGPSLSSRPMEPLLNALEQIGVSSESCGGLPPVTVRGTRHIKGGEASLPGDVSSQFVSALLTIAPLADTPVNISLTSPLESRPYVGMTVDAMRAFGVEAMHTSDMMSLTAPLGSYKATVVTVEGDWSSASYSLAAGALVGEARVTGLSLDSSQADRSIIEILTRMGAEVKISRESITTRVSKLRSISVDLSDCPDLFPVVSSLCAAAEGESNLTGLTRLRLKESDRVAAMSEGLTRMGAKVRCYADSATISGGKLRGAEVDPWDDHRIAMSLAVIALKAEGETTIKNAGCVSKSYPRFWKDLAALGGRIEV